MNPHVIGIIVVILGLIALSSMALARRRAHQERGLKPIYEVVCPGQFGRLGLFGVSLPCIRLAIYPNFIVICFLRPVVIPWPELAFCEPRGFWLLRRLYVESKSGRVWRLSLRNAAQVAALVTAPGRQ